MSAILVVAATFTTWRVVGPKSSLDWFFDEMWRVDLLRRSDWRAVYVAEATPVTAFWFFALRVALVPRFFGPAATRAIAGILMALGPLGVGALARSVLATTLLASKAWSRTERTIGAVAVMFLVGGGRFVAETGSYVNPYLFEAGATLAVLAWCASVRPDRPLWLGPRLAIVGLGAATIGGLFVLPGVAMGLFWRAIRLDPHLRQREMFLHVVTFMAAAAVVAASYVGMYSSGGTRGSTKEFFAGEQFTGTVTDIPAQYLRFVVGSLQWNGPFSSTLWISLPLFLVGLLVVVRSRPLIAGSVGLAIAACIGISPITGWPAVAYRVNATLVLAISALAAVGLISLLRLALRLAVDDRLANSISLTTAVVVALVNWTPQTIAPPWEFARGLTDDLAPIVRSPYESNLVVTYHFMAKWYVHDRLVTGHRDNEPQFTLLNDHEQDRSLYERLPQLVDDRTSPETAVWCVLPWDIGPVDFAAACDLASTGREQMVFPKGIRSQVILWKPRSS